jgi:hypothetical protein
MVVPPTTEVLEQAQPHQEGQRGDREELHPAGSAGIGRLAHASVLQYTVSLEGYALIQHEHRGNELGALLHGGDHVTRAQEHLKALLRGLLVEGAATGHFRKDTPPNELAAFCLHALSGAAALSSKAAVRRLVAVTMAGLRPPR